jgi:hypothetical protein
MNKYKELNLVERFGSDGVGFTMPYKKSTRMKTLNKNHIKELMSDGCKLINKTLEAKIYIYDKDNNNLGAVRYDTYLRMCSNREIQLISENLFQEVYILRRKTNNG